MVQADPALVRESVPVIISVCNNTSHLLDKLLVDVTPAVLYTYP
jgi:hypothetical protein